MNFNPGDTFGDYEILSPIGSGGMGSVFRVRNLISGRMEAMKVLRTDIAADPEFAERFAREIQLLAGLNHPNVASLYTAQRVNGQTVMIMEYVDGVTLAQKLRARPIPLADGLQIISQVLAALEYAHKHGVIHRDIKPDNILIGPDGTVKLTDFGIARAASDPRRTRTGILVGTLHYMSPEQIRARGESLDGRSDLYSVGIILYEIATGRRPFEADSDFEIMAAHIQQQPPPPITLAPGLPAGLNEVILKALAKDPALRCQTAHEMAAAIAACMARPDAPPPIPTSPPPPPNRGPFTPRLFLAAAAALLLGTGLVLGVHLASRSRHRHSQAATNILAPLSSSGPVIAVSYASLVEASAGGAVTYHRGADDDQSHWEPLPVNTILSSGDSVCAQAARAEIVVDQRNFLRIGAGACLQILQDAGRLFQFKLTSGAATLSANIGGISFEADTPALTFTTESAGVYRIGIAAGGAVHVRLQAGAGVVTTPDGAFDTLHAPAEFQASTASAQAGLLPVSPPDDWAAWNQQRNQAIASSASLQNLPPGVSPVNLDGYGRWIAAPAYGNVWVPNAGPGWVPYRLGRWTWVDPFGWTWTSYEPWGFTPYHFGRWANLSGLGWAWIPGPPTTPQPFEPALVGFASGTYAGDWIAWLPLAPGEPYRPVFTISPGAPSFSRFANQNAVTVVNRSEITHPSSTLYTARSLAPTLLQRSVSATFPPLEPTPLVAYSPAVSIASTGATVLPQLPPPSSATPPPDTLNRPVVARRNIVPTLAANHPQIIAPPLPTLHPRTQPPPIPPKQPTPPPPANASGFHPFTPAQTTPNQPVRLDAFGSPIPAPATANPNSPNPPTAK
jgi:serine/threonine protein kinase